METFEVFRTRVTEFDEENRVKEKHYMLTYSTLDKAIQHLEATKILYNGRMYDEGKWTHVAYEDNGREYIEDIQVLVVY